MRTDATLPEARARFVAATAPSGATKPVWSTPQPPRVVRCAQPVPTTEVKRSRTKVRHGDLARHGVRAMAATFARLWG
jgi:hypothetical protein